MDDPSTVPEKCPSLLPAGDNAEMPLIPLQRSLIVVGSREDAHVQLKSHTVSRTHAVIIVEPLGVYIHDLASREGVFVNRQQIHDTLIEDGDEVRIGRFEFIFQAGGVDASLGPPVPAPAAHLRIKGDRFPLAQRVTSIGRRQGMDVILDNEDVSATHALIYVHQGRHVLRDLNSRTGVMLNGRLLSKKAELLGGEVIRIGPTTMRYVLDEIPEGRPSEAASADDGMSAAMMEIVAAEEPDVPAAAADASEPAPESTNEAQLRGDGAGDSGSSSGRPDSVQSAQGATAVLAPPVVHAAPAEIPSVAPARAIVEAAVALDFSVEGRVLETESERRLQPLPAAKELHHVLIGSTARSPLVIPASATERCPARLMAARDHPLCDVGEVALETAAATLEIEPAAIPVRPVAPRASTPAPKPPGKKRPTIRVPVAKTPAAAPPTKPPKPEKSKYTASGEYRIDFDEDDEDNDPRAAMQRTAVAFMQDSIIGMPIAEVEAAPDPFTLGDVFKPKGKQLPGLILSYRSATATSGPSRRPPGIPPTIPPRPVRR